MQFAELKSLLSQPIYGQTQKEKSTHLVNALRDVVQFHYDHCAPYKKLCQKRDFDPEKFENLEDIPYLTTSLFKDELLLSIPEDDVFREIRSSATSSGRSSRMGIDKPTSRRQSKCFNKAIVATAQHRQTQHF